jgi:hypothetical protein
VKIFVSIDDTDNLESMGTGHLAARLISQIEEKGWGSSSFITRHQLFVHPDVPYTSHNSAMCFQAELKDSSLAGLIDYAASFLRQQSAPGSDPGLCIAICEMLKFPAEILDFGRGAKEQVLTKDAAYSLAARLGIHLSEHGGTGGGVIGALAGVGLRLSGNDGRIRGKIQLENENGITKVARVCSRPEVASVQSLAGQTLANEERIVLGEKVKTVLLDNKPVLLVAPLETPSNQACWRTCTKEELRIY